jgi:hypothetical protein
MSRAAALGGALVTLVTLGLATTASAQEPAPLPEGWRAIEGIWSAVGTRQTLPTEGDRPAALVYVSGAIVLTSGDGLRRGFQGEAIYFDDGKGLGAGRCVWTDDHGDRIFSKIKGEQVETGRRVAGTITGGTGRYAGLVGDYTLTWQYVVEAEPGVFQGRTVTLKGRYRPAEVKR